MWRLTFPQCTFLVPRATPVETQFLSLVLCTCITRPALQPLTPTPLTTLHSQTRVRLLRTATQVCPTVRRSNHDVLCCLKFISPIFPGGLTSCLLGLIAAGPVESCLSKTLNQSVVSVLRGYEVTVADINIEKFAGPIEKEVNVTLGRSTVKAMASGARTWRDLIQPDPFPTASVNYQVRRMAVEDGTKPGCLSQKKRNAPLRLPPLSLHCTIDGRIFPLSDFFPLTFLFLKQFSFRGF